MKIKVGEYARTTTGEICKIEDILSPKEIKEHSKKIIDLIEVGDYVNGYKVIDIIKGFKVIIDKLELDTITGTYKNIGIIDIKTIVTHEQFKEMEYEV